MPEVRTNIADEVRLIPWWAFGLAVVLFVGLQVIMLAAPFPNEPHPTPLGWRVFIGVIGGAVLAFFVLLVGYVNRDAKRRGMNAVLWTVLVIFVPDAIGFIIYFLLRHPLRTVCPQCGASADTAFNFCPRCKFNLHPACPQCHRPVQAGDLYCPFCGRELAGSASRFTA